METAIMTAYEQIAHRIAKANNKSEKYYREVFVDKYEPLYSLRELGFTSVQNLKTEKLAENDIVRSKLKAYFQKPVLHDDEIKAIEKMFNLTTLPAARYVDMIPDANVKEIISYHDWIRREQKNFGKMTTEKYFIPLTQTHLVTAPKEMFRKPLDITEMSRDEYIKWLEEDPLVLRKVWRFNPGQLLEQHKNLETPWNVVVTAWGVEALFVNTKAPSRN